VLRAAQRADKLLAQSHLEGSTARWPRILEKSSQSWIHHINSCAPVAASAAVQMQSRLGPSPVATDGT
jgi:hypothetical protein